MARHDEQTPTPTTPAGKGRPTPKRSEAERGRRQPVAAPTTGKEASRLRRLEAQDARTRMRTAMATGDEKNLPARDRGPIRRYARDFVDVRLSLSEWFIPIAVPLYLATFLGARHTIGALAGIAIMIVFILNALELTLMTFQLRRALKKKFPEQSLKGVRLYAVTRSTQLRRMRAPKPQIKRFAPLD